MLQRLHDEHFAVLPHTAIVHKLVEDSFRLLRINGRAANLAMVVAIQPYGRSFGRTDPGLRELITSYFRDIDGDLSMGKRGGQ